MKGGLGGFQKRHIGDLIKNVDADRMLTWNLLFFLQKKQVASARASDQKSVDQSILANIKKESLLSSYLATSFYLRNGDKPHEMKW